MRTARLLAQVIDRHNAFQLCQYDLAFRRVQSLGFAYRHAAFHGRHQLANPCASQITNLRDYIVDFLLIHFHGMPVFLSLMMGGGACDHPHIHARRTGAF